MSSSVGKSPKSVKERFDAAVSVIKSLPKDGPFQPSNTVKLRFYALYKQSTEGPCTATKPSFWDAVGRAKWEAWTVCGKMSSELAMQMYIEEIKQIVETMPQSPEVERFLRSIAEDSNDAEPPPEAANSTGGAVVGGGAVGGAPEGQPASGTGETVESADGGGSNLGGAKGEEEEVESKEEIEAKAPSGKDGLLSEVAEENSQKDSARPDGYGVTTSEASDDDEFHESFQALPVASPPHVVNTKPSSSPSPSPSPLVTATSFSSSGGGAASRVASTTATDDLIDSPPIPTQVMTSGGGRRRRRTGNEGADDTVPVISVDAILPQVLSIQSHLHSIQSHLQSLLQQFSSAAGGDGSLAVLPPAQQAPPASPLQQPRPQPHPQPHPQHQQQDTNFRRRKHFLCRLGLFLLSLPFVAQFLLQYLRTRYGLWPSLPWWVFILVTFLHTTLTVTFVTFFPRSSR